MNYLNSYRNFLFIINPIAGGIDKILLQKNIIKILNKNYFFNFEIVQTNAYNYYQILVDKILVEKFTDIIILGGDGTVNKITHQLKHLPVQFGIIPLGSGNGLARSAGIPLDFENALHVILKGHTQHIDAFNVNSNYACMLAGIGFDAAVAHNFSLKKERGFISYVKSTLEQQKKLQSYPIDIIIDHKKFSIEVYLLCIANSNQFGNNIKIAPNAQLNDGLLDIVIVPSMNQMKLPFQFIKHFLIKNVRAKHNINNQQIDYFQTKSITIINKNNAPMHIDGEPIESIQNIQIDIIENAFKLIIP